VALQFVATNKGLLLSGKMTNGVAVGALLAVGSTYASEVRTGPLLLQASWSNPGQRLLLLDCAVLYLAVLPSSL